MDMNPSMENEAERERRLRMEKNAERMRELGILEAADALHTAVEEPIEGPEAPQGVGIGCSKCRNNVKLGCRRCLVEAYAKAVMDADPDRAARIRDFIVARQPPFVGGDGSFRDLQKRVVFVGPTPPSPPADANANASEVAMTILGEDGKPHLLFSAPYRELLDLKECSVLGLCVKESSVPGAGQGVFATRRFPEGTLLCKYHGELLTHEQKVERYPGDITGPYAIDVGKDGHAIDGIAVRGIGPMINHAPEGKSPNAEYVENDDGNLTVSIFATCPIKPGEEIFTEYGEQYRFAEGTCVDIVDMGRT